MPACSVIRMPQGETPRQKGFFYRKVGTEQRIRILLEAYARLKADPQEWPLTMVGDGLEGRSFAYTRKGIRGATPWICQ